MSVCSCCRALTSCRAATLLHLRGSAKPCELVSLLKSNGRHSLSDFGGNVWLLGPWLCFCWDKENVTVLQHLHKGVQHLEHVCFSHMEKLKYWATSVTFSVRILQFWFQTFCHVHVYSPFLIRLAFLVELDWLLCLIISRLSLEGCLLNLWNQSNRSSVIKAAHFWRWAF